MMPSREKKILISLLVILSALVVYRIATRGEPKRVKELTYKPGMSLQGPNAEVHGGESIRKHGRSAEMLKTEKRVYKGVIRNPFQPLYPPSPPPLIISPPPTPITFPVITTKAPSLVQIESGKFKFLGFLQKEGDKKIFLSKEKEVFIVRKGDSVGVFHVGEITENSVTLVARDTGEEMKLTIEEVKPTRPVFLPGAGRR